MSNRTRTPLDMTNPADRYRAARLADAPSDDPCPACGVRHESASAEADCIADREDDVRDCHLCEGNPNGCIYCDRG